MAKPTQRALAGQPAWVVRSKTVELALTCRGGQMAPVTFARNSRKPIQPYYISPWQGLGVKTGEPVLDPLRGDFFCMPFGGNAEAFQGEQHRVHGETAGARWSRPALQTEGKRTVLTASMNTRTRKGKVTKRLALLDGQDAVYCQHLLEGYAGPMPLGHHATLAMSETPGSLRISTSAFQLGRTNPFPADPPLENQYQALAVDKPFTDLRKVPLRCRDLPPGDLTRFPAREGYTDILAICKTPGRYPAWVTAVNNDAGYLWFSLKDPAVLPTTVFWISNRGRQSPPWNGQNRCLGLEDVCGYFAEGLAASARANPLSRAGFPTAVKLRPDQATTMNVIQGAVRVPKTFQAVKRVSFQPGKVTFTGHATRPVTVSLHWEFLRSGELPD